MVGTKKEQGGDLSSIFTSGTAFQELLARQTEGWLKAQADMFQTMAMITEGWLNGRREGATSALQTFQRMSECDDLGKMMTVYTEWLNDRVKKLSDEAAALGEQAASLNKAAVSAFQEAGRSAADASETAVEGISDAAKRAAG